MAWRICVCVCGLAVSASTAGCSATAPHPGRVKPAPTSSPVESSGDNDALAAYTGMWSDYANASHSSNWQDSALTHHATAAALAAMVNGLFEDQQQGLVSKGAPVLHPRVVHSTPTSVDISDCASSIGWLEYTKATGKLQNDVPGGSRLLTAHVDYADGLWRVTRYTVGELGSC